MHGCQVQLSSLKKLLIEAGAWDACKHNEDALRRFLKARNWDVEAAQKMWLASLSWRTQVGADTILQEQLMTREQEERLIELYPHGLHGVDRMVRRNAKRYSSWCSRAIGLI